MRRFHTRISSSTPPATTLVSSDAEPAFAASTRRRSTNSPGTGSASVMPKKSFSWVLAMTSAMPLVNPITTGRGMKRGAGEPPDDEQHARHHRAHEQSIEAVLRDDPGHDHH